MSHYKNIVNELKNISQQIILLTRAESWEMIEEILVVIKTFGKQIESNGVKTDEDVENLIVIKQENPTLFANIVYDNLMLLIEEYEQLLALEKQTAIVHPFEYNGMQMALLKDEETNHRFIYETEELIAEVTNQLNSNTEVVIVVGFGSGAIHSNLVKSYRVLTIDPFSLSNNSSRDIISLFDAEGLNQLTQQLSSFIGLKTKIVAHPSYTSSPRFVDILRQVRDLWQSAQIDLTTRVLYTEKWYRQSFLNTEILQSNIDRILNIDTLKDVHKGEKALMVAGGPSLEEALPYLKKAQKYYYIVSIGQTAKVLLENGIKPDYVVSIDTEMANVHFFKEMELDMPLVYSLQVHHQIPKDARGVLIPYVDNEISKKLLPYSKTSFATAPTVAISAVSFMNYVGFNSIGLIGQDLALRQGEYYSASVKRTASNEGQLNKTLYDVELNNGEMGKTTPILANFLRNYKTILSTYPNLKDKLINYSAYGAKIEQVPFEPLENILQNTRKKMIPLLTLGIDKDVTPSVETMTNLFSSMIKELSKIEKKFESYSKQRAITKKEFEKALRDWDAMIELKNFRAYIMPLQLVNLIVIQNKIKFHNQRGQSNSLRIEILTLMKELLQQLLQQLKKIISSLDK